MLKINTYKLKLNEFQIKKIVNITESEQSKMLVQKYAQIVKSRATPKLPEAPIHKGKATPLKNALTITTAKLKKTNINVKGNKYKTKAWNVLVKPKKRQIYYFVIMSGKNTYNTKEGSVKKVLKYSKASAEKFPVENAYKKIKGDMTADFEKLIMQVARGLNGK